MRSPTAWPWPPGYEVLRILSEGAGGVVALARRADGDIVALKLRRLPPGVDREEALEQQLRFQPLTAGPGLLPILNGGLSADRVWLWEELAAAWDLDGSPPSVAEDYQPSTLRSELIEQGPFSSQAVVAIGLVLCAGLERLHGAGWVHRDVKPGNLFRLQGGVVLGDYGLMGAPGTPFDFKGTEGFVPSEGAAGVGGDLYALGKTLYELWTGCDRLEFPTIPPAVLKAADWEMHGALLNKVLLRACSPQARHRYATAAEFAADLRLVAQGRPAWVRQRRWVAAGLTIGALAGLMGLAVFWPRPVSVRWERDASGVMVTVQGRSESGAMLLYQAGEMPGATNLWSLLAQTNTPLPARLPLPAGTLGSNPPPVPFQVAYWPRRTVESLAPSGMVLVPPGTISLVAGQQGGTNAGPSRRVDVAGFFLDRREVSGALWNEVAVWATNQGYVFRSGDPGPTSEDPVQGVTWEDALKWCNARSEKEGRVPAYYTGNDLTQVYRQGHLAWRPEWVRWTGGYRLPTGAEWERAVRAGLLDDRNPRGNTPRSFLVNDQGTRRRSPIELDLVMSMPGFRTVLPPDPFGMPPVLVLPLSGQTCEPGAAVRWVVGASGTEPLDFQWRREGRPIRAGTNAVLALPSVSTADVGDYDVVVANAHGRATSRVARLSLLTAPAIAVHPSSRTNQAGSTHVFRVTATGAPPLEYRWRRDDRAVPGGTQAELRVDPVTAADAGSYTVVVSNRFGSVTSRVARFSVVAFLPPDPLQMAWVPPGSFPMGDSFAEGNDNERPVHTVTVSGFFMDRHEVTRGLWEDVWAWAVNHGYRFEAGPSGREARHPVHAVTWHDAVKWCNARSEREGHVPAYYQDADRTQVYRTGAVAVANAWVRWTGGYRLPTEAEWERAARGGVGGRRFPWGDSIMHSLANYRSDTNHGWDVSLTRNFHPDYAVGGVPYTSPVGSFGANGFGLHDLVGNVREWCWDWRGDDYYGESPATDPRGPESGLLRVVRGGAWVFNASVCRIAARGSRVPEYKDHGLGFRAVLAPNQP